MKEINLNCQNGQDFKVLIDEELTSKINSHLWRSKFKDGRVYFATTINGKDVYLNRFIMNVTDSNIVVSYQDGNTLNNQKSNFVLTTKSHSVVTPQGQTQVRDSVITITQDNSVSTAKVPESNDEMIERVCMEFIDDQKLFTSVDISNHIKRSEKRWIRNREVTAFLNSNWHLLTPHMVRVLISVNNRRENAWLYYEDDNDYEKYDGQNQKAITPDEFQEILKN